MTVALRSGVPAAAWLDDPNALMTAVELYREMDAAAEAERKKAERG